MTASPKISFGLYALGIKKDVTLSTSTATQTFSHVDDLKTGNITAVPYASYEPNFWLLDGGYKIKPASDNEVHIGLMSVDQSDANGNFVVPPVLIADFSTTHSTDGLTLHFSQHSGDYATSIQVSYFDANLLPIQSDIYSPTGWELIINQAVNNFKRVVITFNSTNRPFRYLRLTGVDFGALVNFTGTDIQTASVVEEIDPLSGEARYNTFDFELYSADAAFNPLNPTGVYQSLQQRQPISLYEDVDGSTLFIGQFFTDTWKNTSDNQIEFHCIDLLGVCDTIAYMGNMWFRNAAGLIIRDMLTPLGIPYALDPDLYWSNILGWLPICTIREALQQIALSIGAYIDCSNSSILNIRKLPTLATSVSTDEITNAQKGINQSLELKSLVTGVKVISHNYIQTSTVQTIFSGVLSIGSYTITFSQPMHDIAVTGATISAYGANYATLTVSSPGTVTLTGQTYQDTQKTFSVMASNLPAGAADNIYIVDASATLMSEDNAQAVAQRIYDYFQQRLQQTVKLYAPVDIHIGKIVTVDTLFNQKILALVERMSMDLSGGFRVTAKMTGVKI